MERNAENAENSGNYAMIMYILQTNSLLYSYDQEQVSIVLPHLSF